MNFFKKTFAWIKANLFIVICAVLSVLSIALTTVVHLQGATFQEDVKKRDSEFKNIEALARKNVQIPPATPDGLPRTLPITVNQAALDDIREVYLKLRAEYNAVFRYALQVNQNEHLPMIEGLFPEPNKSASKPYEARIRYREIFHGKIGERVGDFFQPYSQTAGYPQLNAKPAPSAEEIKFAKDRATSDYTGGLFKTETQLTPAEQQRLQDLQAEALKKLFVSRAASINVYAETDPRVGGFPFQVMEWHAYKTTPPTDREIWEGQMQIWIQQDICKAIALCNNVRNKEANVMNMPIKHLLKIEVPPLNVTGTRDAAVGAIKPGAGRLDILFGAAPTGRVSNALYDVRHAKVTLIADVTKLPEFFDALCQVNFMTVLRMEMADIDAYQAFKEGYVYGAGNPMKITLLIETVWMREWLLRLMPEDVKTTGGIAGGAGASTGTGTGTPAGGPRGPGGGTPPTPTPTDLPPAGGG